ncbi:MAG: site-specific integrase [Woeseiaceae bacterium]
MTQTYFPDPRVRQRLYEGPLAICIDAFAERLTGQGYSGATAREKLRLVAHLSRWLDGNKLRAEDLNEACIARFRRYRRRLGRLDHQAASTCKALLAQLRGAGVIPPVRDPREDNAQRRIEDDYEAYLVRERGLAPATIVNYTAIVRDFLAANPKLPDTLCPDDLHAFIRRRSTKLSRRRLQLVVTGLRRFLRYLQQRGAIRTDLAAAVPTVACWRCAEVPKTITPAQVERLLTSCDPATAAGRRDRAILLLLARLGLRASEVVALRLDDIDWDTGSFIVQGKGSRREVMPLFDDVGQALADYLSDGRPVCASRRVFVRLCAPYRGLKSPSSLCDIVKRALARAGIDAPFKGAHLLRHSLATRLLGSGASLAEIGELLRHQRLETTQIYAKLDLGALRSLAQPWPGGAP